LFITVRDAFLEDVRAKWDLDNCIVFKACESQSFKAAAEMAEIIFPHT